MGRRLDMLEERPRVRGDCVDGPRPCPWVRCRHHLLINKVLKTGELKLTAGDPDALPQSCSLDVADEGPHILADIATLLGVSRQAADRIEHRALRAFKPLVSRELLNGWVNPTEGVVVDDWGGIFNKDFYAAVDRAFKSIVLGRERGEGKNFNGFPVARKAEP